MLEEIKRLFRTWLHLLHNDKFRLSFSIGLIWLLAALFLNYFISSYNDTFVASGVGDLILDNIPTVDLNNFYTLGLYITLWSLAVMAYFHPEKTPFALKTFAIFIIVRSFFIILTHIGPPTGFYDLAGPNPDSPFLQKFFFLNDLFFSAHTGLPFLAFLIFKGTIYRYFYLLASILMGMTVLLMHVHYSIDVFGAYFITYSIYHLSDGIFRKLNMGFKDIVKTLDDHEKNLLKEVEKDSY